MTNPNRPQPLLILSDARGIYIPRDFATEINRECVTGIAAIDLDILASGPEHPDYWEVWDIVTLGAIVTNPADGQRYRVYQDGDCWLLPEGMEVNDDGEFVWSDDVHGLDCECTDCRDARGDWEYHNRKENQE